ncbi:5'-nucleotidase [Flavobacterium sp.]|jgi:5'-nucleotidase|uniref:5'-nucleotidase n=1 Tax=Flavobacterium sp. TaxID=239 RepID=UPI0022BAD48A|nr:5'-nucleotidase [Flavobacterium sp.]MCZ8143777.1 5'-nucleotidase [Flavobacterium sp.]MCZ8367424.1 5'-nucleotidase [Flavobacterium sp.]
MQIDFTKILVVGVSSRALFNLEEEEKIFKEKNVRGFREYQFANEDKLLEKGTAFPLVEALLKLNKHVDSKKPIVEVVIMSKNSPETGLRILKSIQHYELPITRWAFSAGEPLAPFIKAFNIDLFLSKDENDVQKIIDSSSCATALVYDPPADFKPETERVKFAFDADAVVFSEESEIIYKTQNIDAFHQHEKANENVPLNDGPFAALLRKLSDIQDQLPVEKELSPLRIAIVTARNSPSHMRVVKTLRSWNVYVDEAYFLGGWPKAPVLEAIGTHIFFDDQDRHLVDSQTKVPCGKVLYKSDSILKTFENEMIVKSKKTVNQ